jgi:hypothetical protein
MPQGGTGGARSGNRAVLAWSLTGAIHRGPPPGAIVFLTVYLRRKGAAGLGQLQLVFRECARPIGDGFDLSDRGKNDEERQWVKESRGEEHRAVAVMFDHAPNNQTE